MICCRCGKNSISERGTKTKQESEQKKEDETDRSSWPEAVAWLGARILTGLKQPPVLPALHGTHLSLYPFRPHLLRHSLQPAQLHPNATEEVLQIRQLSLIPASGRTSQTPHARPIPHPFHGKKKREEPTQQPKVELHRQEYIS